jgi:hypothetical protein
LALLIDARRINRGLKPPDNRDVLRILDFLASERDQAGESDGAALSDVAIRRRAQFDKTK